MSDKGVVWCAEERQGLMERETSKKKKPGRDTVASEDEVRPENLLPTFTLTRALTHSFTHLLIHIKSDTHS